MRGYELTDALHTEFRRVGTASSRVVAIDAYSGNTFTIVGVETEHHTDADGSYTTWLKINMN